MTGDLSNPRAGTHLPMLARCLSVTEGAVLEVGRGAWSSPWLWLYCRAAGRELVSVDDQPEWVEGFPEYPGLTVDYDVALPSYATRRWSVVFLDHSPGERRADDALLFRDVAELVVVHDYDKGAVKRPFDKVLLGWRFWRVDRATLVLCREESLWSRLW